LIFVRSGRVVLVVVRPAGRAVPGGSGFLVCADAGGPVGAGAGFGDVAAKVSLSALAARSHGSVRALVRLAAAGRRAASRTGPGSGRGYHLSCLRCGPGRWRQAGLPPGGDSVDDRGEQPVGYRCGLQGGPVDQRADQLRGG
jgi:hypothetical protein